MCRKSSITENTGHRSVISLNDERCFNKKIQIRVAIDLNFVADKVQPLHSTTNDTTSNRRIVTRKFVTLTIVPIETLSNGAQ